MSKNAARIRLTPRNLSPLVWAQFMEQAEFELPSIVGTLRDISARCEQLRGNAQYNTGSMLLGSALSLYLAVRALRPASIFEVGTFIGKSTLAMGLAMEHAGTGGRILTCDASNDIALPETPNIALRQFPLTTSTDALRQCLREGITFDFLHIDGRLADDDLGLLAQVCAPETVIALDDFEGMEKGIANLVSLRRLSAFARHACVYPMPVPMAEAYGAVCAPLTALLIPATSLAITNQ